MKATPMFTLKSAAILVLAVTLAGCAAEPEPLPAPAPITPEVTYDKLGNPV